MLSLVKNFKNDFLEEPVEKKLNPATIERIVIAGMGGSAISGYVMLDIFQDSLLMPVDIVRDYFLPKVDANTLVLCVSYSGNTEETLSCYEAAKKMGAQVIAISSGGKLIEKVKANSDGYVQIKTGIPPRVAFPYLFSTLLEVLIEIGALRESMDSINEIVKSMDVEELASNAVILADNLYGFIPSIYTYNFPGVAMRVKGEFNENSKIPAKYEVFPELNHNDIVGWQTEMAKKFKVILLRSDDEPTRIAQRIAITKKLLEDRVGIMEYHMRGASRLEKALNTIVTFDLVSIMLAEKYNVNAQEVEIIENLKKELAKQS